QQRHLRVVMLVSGFPTSDQPANGIFNSRAAKMLSEAVDINVVHLRAWKPHRRLLAESNNGVMRVITVAIPQTAGSGHFNTLVYRALGWPLIRRVINNCDLIHSVDLGFAGILGSAWGRLAGVRHILQLTTDLERTLKRWRRPFVGWEEYTHGVACN